MAVLLTAHALEGEFLHVAGVLSAVAPEPPLAPSIAVLNAVSSALAVALRAKAHVVPDERAVPVLPGLDEMHDTGLLRLEHRQLREHLV